jgi:hypothetical protein
MHGNRVFNELKLKEAATQVGAPSRPKPFLASSLSDYYRSSISIFLVVILSYRIDFKSRAVNELWLVKGSHEHVRPRLLKSLT